MSMQTAMNEVRAAQDTTENDTVIVKRWLQKFESALTALDRKALEQLFTEDPHWRDLFAFTWTVTPCDTREAVVSTLLREQPPPQAFGFGLPHGGTPPHRAPPLGGGGFWGTFPFENPAVN